ncbi:MAG: hypothetical protein LUG52_02070 [Clostridia bacterium]|nr:hypothetical protein [Clostridia bacterium]
MKDAYQIPIKVKYTAKIEDVDFFEGQICEAEILKSDASGRWYLIKYPDGAQYACPRSWFAPIGE